MSNIFYNNRGQSLIEYVVLISIIVAALSAMQVYVKRGIQAGIKVAADELGSQYDAEDDPEKGTKSSSNINTVSTTVRNTNPLRGGSQINTIDSYSSSKDGKATYISGKE